MEVTVLEFIGICIQALILSIPFVILMSIPEIERWFRDRKDKK